MEIANLEKFFHTLTNYGWHLEKRDIKPVHFENSFHIRYPKIPDYYLQFLERVRLFTNVDETVWFLTEGIYSGESESAYSWDEFEMMSISAAEGDEYIIKSIKNFWHNHLPIVFSVKSGYAFLAISLFEESYGEIVIGREPEFEDVSRVSSSFEQLIDFLGTAVTNKDISSSLADFL